MRRQNVSDNTKGQIWEHGIHLEWMNRGTFGQFYQDADMTSELRDLEGAVARIFGGRWRATVEENEEAA